ncbi:MAG TPA: hypothetical protein VLG09_02190 [Candidatus Saccharimonadales bacterium]|nr:hypothetical protein [Candidatus Saccharimonadales bacterium]
MTESKQSAVDPKGTIETELVRLINSLPSVDEVYPEWVREAGKKGRITAAEKAAKAAINQRRAIYEATLNGLIAQAAGVGDLEHNSGVRENYIAQREESLRRAGERERVTMTNVLLGQRTLAQLAAMMKGHELEPMPHAQWDLVTQFVNHYGTFELNFGHAPVVLVTPRNKTRAPLLLKLDTEGMTVEAVLMLQAHLGLDTSALTKRARAVLRMPQPKSTTPKKNAIFMVGTSIGRCSDPSCVLYGE